MSELKPTDLAAWRGGLARVKGGQALLDRLIEPHDTARAIRSLPPSTLHHYIHEIGLADAPLVLAYASGKQVRALLDMEIWERDSVSMERLDPWLEVLMHAGPEVLYQRLLEVDDALLTLIVRSTVEAIVVEDPDGFDPPDGEYVVTPDNRLCIHFPHGAPRDLPIKVFLDMLMREDTAHCINLLLASSAALETNLQEDAYRWRSGRMADMGYVDYYDALVIYTPPKDDLLPITPPTGEIEGAWLRPIRGGDLLDQAIAALPTEAMEVAYEHLAYVVNMALSADRVELWDEVARLETLARLRAGLNLGLSALASSPEEGAMVLEATPMALIFRAGYAQMLAAARPLRRVKSSLGALGLETAQPWIEALTRRHPTRPDGRPIASAEDLDEARRWARWIADLHTVAVGLGRPAGEEIAAWLFTAFALDALALTDRQRLPLTHLLDALTALFDEGDLRPEAKEAAALWWRRVGGTEAGALALLLDAAVEQLSAVDPLDFEPRFAPILLLDV
ncbi:hypothetical protein KKB55_07040 [Myxococcota bacterium]|nr:hypothetical protein [Myxococcota bacterium]